MSEVPVPRLMFGTAAAVFSSLPTAEQAAAALVRQGYPRELITVLTGEPWSEHHDGEPASIRPDPELRLKLVPASRDDLASMRTHEEPGPALARFIGNTLWRTNRRSVPVWPVVVLFIAATACLLALVSRDWFIFTVVLVVSLHVVAGAFVLAHARDHVTYFPFRTQIPMVEEMLEDGGALVTVRCTLPYRSRVETILAEEGGRVLGYAEAVIYPVPAT
jgi:hypothetical protein